MKAGTTKFLGIVISWIKTYCLRMIRWAATAACLIASVVVAAWFFTSLSSAMKSGTTASLSCAQGSGVVNNSFTYVQIDVLDQHPIEPYFNGALFVNLANEYGTSPVHLLFTRSAGRSFAQSNVGIDLYQNPETKDLWATKQVDFTIVRSEGVHKDFPFDSAKFDFDLTYSPKGVPIHNVLLRNRNPSFELNCDTYKVEQQPPDKLHIVFELRRNPLVQLTAIVLIGAGLLFLMSIVLFVKTEALPTSVASFFFSLWSIRAILSSEMKTFPTNLDLAVLSLCVLLLVALGFRLGLKNVISKSQ